VLKITSNELFCISGSMWFAVLLIIRPSLATVSRLLEVLVRWKGVLTRSTLREVGGYWKEDKSLGAEVAESARTENAKNNTQIIFMCIYIFICIYSMAAATAADPCTQVRGFLA
jgi:hypothetical protein